MASSCNRFAFIDRAKTLFVSMVNAKVAKSAIGSTPPTY